MTIERHPITDRTAWLAMRGHDITASTAAALLGVHPYITAYGLWALKTGHVSQEDIETPSIKRGRLLEPVALQLLQEMHPDWNAINPKTYYCDTVARLGATPDVLAENKRGRGTIQTKSVERGVFRKHWRDAETGATEPPLWIGVQAIIEAHLAGADWAAIAALVVDHGITLEIVDVPIHEGVIEKVRAATAEFWDMVESGRMPDPDWRRDSSLAARFVVPDGSVDLSADNEVRDLLEERADLKTGIKAVEERLADIDGFIKNKIGLAETAHLPGWKLTFKTVDVREYTVAAKRTRPLRIHRTGKDNP